MATSFGDIEGTLGLDVTAIDALDQYDKKLTESIQVMGQAEQAVKQMDAALASSSQAAQTWDPFPKQDKMEAARAGLNNWTNSLKESPNAFAGLMDKNGELIPQLEKTEGVLGMLKGGLTSVGETTQQFGHLIGEFIKSPLKFAGEAIQGFFMALGPVGAGILAIGTAATFIGTQLWGMGATAAKVGDHIGDMADTMAISTEATSRLDYAMGVAGGSLERGSNLIFQIQTRMASSPKEFGEGLDKIGLSIAELQAMQPDQQLYAISRAFQEHTNSSNRAAVAMDLFSRAGRDSIPLLMKDLTGLAAESERLSVIWSEEDADAAEEFTMATARLDKAISALSTSVGKVLTPAMTVAVELLTDFVVAAGNADEWLRYFLIPVGDAPGAIKKMDDASKDNNKTLTDAEKIYQRAISGQLNLTNATGDAIDIQKLMEDAQKKAAAEAEKATAARKKEEAALIKVGQAMDEVTKSYNESRAAAEAFANAQIAEIPDKELGNFGKWTLPPEFNLSTITAAMSVEQLQRAGLHTAAALRILGTAAGNLPKPVKDAQDAIEEATEKTRDWGKTFESIFSGAANILNNLEGRWYEFGAIIARTGQQAIAAFSSGDMLGGTIALVTGGIAAIGKAFEDQEKKINPIREAYIQTAGGLHELNVQAMEATGSLRLVEDLLDADTEEEYTKALDALNQALEWYNQLEADRAKLAEARLAIGEKQVDNLNAILGPLSEQTRQWSDLEEQIAAAKKEGKEFDELLAQQAGTIQYSATQLEDLGLIAVATFSSALASGMSFSQAVEAAGPALKTLEEAFRAVGVETDNEYLRILMVQGAILDNNPALLKAIGALGESFAGLDAMGQLNVETFRAMERTGSDMYARLQAEVAATGGATEDALLPMQDFLHDAEEAAKKLGIPLDENTQMLIDQSKELGIWKEQGKSATDLLIDKMNELVDSVAKFIDNLNNIPDTEYTVTERWQRIAADNGFEAPEAPATSQAMGGTGRANGPTWFYTAGNEDWAFSGEGKTFEDRMQADSGGSGPDLSFLPQMIKDGIRDGFQEARGAA